MFKCLYYIQLDTIIVCLLITSKFLKFVISSLINSLFAATWVSSVLEFVWYFALFYLKWLLLDPKLGPGKPWNMWLTPRLILLRLLQLQIGTFFNSLLTKGVSVVVHMILEVSWLLLWLQRMRGSREVGKCSADCLSCPNLSCSLEAESNLTGKTYS